MTLRNPIRLMLLAPSLLLAACNRGTFTSGLRFKAGRFSQIVPGVLTVVVEGICTAAARDEFGGATPLGLILLDDFQTSRYRPRRPGRFPITRTAPQAAG
jgi:hypothetical protein